MDAVGRLFASVPARSPALMNLVFRLADPARGLTRDGQVVTAALVGFGLGALAFGGVRWPLGVAVLSPVALTRLARAGAPAAPAVV